ncbi:MAG: zinc ribbon domain-containing protein, partial [Methanoregula sp.]|nr:zinc ribbon domain-containing protein [Methanoregula sp.]
MKCPHCGMNIRDEITECGYCGGRVTPRIEKAAAGAGRFSLPKGSTSQSGAQRAQKIDDEPETEEEEGGGLSAVLQPGEQVLIGSLNVTVKKFFFNAYLTNQRIFLIDTQEKKIKVTAKDVARDTIVGSIVEFSE